MTADEVNSVRGSCLWSYLCMHNSDVLYIKMCSDHLLD